TFLVAAAALVVLVLAGGIAFGRRTAPPQDTLAVRSGDVELSTGHHAESTPGSPLAEQQWRYDTEGMTAQQAAPTRSIVAVPPDGARLAYLAPGGAEHCGGSHNTWALIVRDLATGTIVTDAAAQDVSPVGDPVAAVQPAWVGPADTLVLKARRPDAENLAGRCP